MSDNLPAAAGTSALATVAGFAAGIVGGPAAAVACGFIAGLPVVPMVLIAGLAVAIWFNLVIGVMLLVAVVLAVLGFFFGSIRGQLRVGVG